MDVRISECLAWLQKIRAEQNLVAVMLLSADQVDHGTRCDELRIPHLLKPVKPSELLSAAVCRLQMRP